MNPKSLIYISMLALLCLGCDEDSRPPNHLDGAAGSDAGETTNDIGSSGTMVDMDPSGAMVDMGPAGTGEDMDPAGTIMLEVPTEFEATPLPPLSIKSTLGCSIDQECDRGLHCFESSCVALCSDTRACENGGACSERGRCASNQKEDIQGSSAKEIYLERLPESVHFIDYNQAELRLEFSISGPDASTAHEIKYHIESDNHLLDNNDVYTAALIDKRATINVNLTPNGGDLFDELEEEFTALRLVTEAGAVNLSLVRLPSVSGLYAGQVRVFQFGSISFASEFQIVTSPEGVSLEDADQAWLLMPQGRDHMFSPVSVTPLSDEVAEPLRWISSPLTFDVFAERWVATFDYSFPFEDSSHFYHEDPEQIQRSMRVEFSVEDDRSLYGFITDRWRGMYESRTPNGTPETPRVSFDSEFSAVRVGDAIEASEIVEVPSNAAVPNSLPLPSLDLCDEGVIHLIASGCEGYSDEDGATFTIEDFTALTDEDRALCAINAAENSLNSDSTTEMIVEFLDGDDETPNGMSFAEFMEACALGTDGICIATQEVTCARSLVAYAYVAPDNDTGYGSELIDAYQKVTRESFLGRQLAAFEKDTDLRLEWLQTQTYPAIITNEIKEETEELLNNWVDLVLNVHFSVLSGQFDATGLAILSRQPTSEAGIIARRELLFEMSQSWRAAMNALTLATTRWNHLFQDTARRSEYTQLVSEKMFELYLIAGVAINLNLRAGAGFANATFTGGFGSLLREVRKLSLPFNQLIYARDAEVVVSRSLDPMSNQFNLLRDYKESAHNAIDEAESLTAIIETESTERELSRAEITDRLNNEISTLRGEIVELCGLPEGCSLNDYIGRPECTPRVTEGTCGFNISVEDNQIIDLQAETPSEAGRKLLKIKEAILNVSIAEEELRAVAKQADLELESARAFQDIINSWNEDRLAGLSELDALITNRATEWSQAMTEIGESIIERNRLRAMLVESAQNDADSWNSIRISGINSDFATLRAARYLDVSADGLIYTADKTTEITNAIIDGMPTTTGASTDTSFPARFAARLSEMATTSALKLVAKSLNIATSEMRSAVDQDRALRSAELARLSNQSMADDLELKRQIEELADQAALDLTEQQIRESQLDRIIEQMVRVREAELAYERDLVELRDRRDQAYTTIIREGELMLRIKQARLSVKQRILEYQQVSQKAAILSEQLRELENQRQNINLIIGSPSVVFAWANRLAQVENKLQIAKNRLLDWLVTLEYYAVRPFIDQRIQILLSKNTYQLEEIAQEMERLEGVCGGGEPTEQAITLSLRNHLKLNEALLDSATGEEMTPQERFLELLAEKNISAGKRTQIGTSLNVGNLISRESSLALSFTLNLDQFANLRSACNAKIKSIDVSLIGEGLGEGLPSVNIIYSGASQLRSCQPRLQEYIDLFEEGSTSFGEVTTFRSPTRSIAPVAGINEFASDADGTGNLSLSGLPLSSEYTILIDMTNGDNEDINWEALSDIQLKFNYIYQDFFSIGDCQ